MKSLARLWAVLGPGLIWAGTAVGVSHLVQSTRAGAGFGLGLVWVVLFANLIKYPAFAAGVRYPIATGRSLLHGYRQRGRWMVGIFLLVTLATMLTVVAAVTIVAAGMATALAGLPLSVSAWSGLLLALSVAMLAVGRFALLERFMKVMMLLLAASTLVAVLSALPGADWSAMRVAPWWPSGVHSEWLFVAALIGWMPSALDIAVWQSLWSVERANLRGEGVNGPAARLDFRVGYVGTALLALGFVLLGAILLAQAGELPSSAGAFAVALIDAYTSALGSWARPVLLVAAFSTMLSTTVAVVDGFPRALEGAVLSLGRDEAPRRRTPLYWGAMLLVAVGAWVIIAAFAGKLLALVDLATTLTGLTAPVLAAMNLAVLLGSEVPEAQRPRGWDLLAHVGGIVALAVVAAAYLYARFVAG